MKPLRGLCVGAGYFSRFHLEAWRRMPDVEIVGLCDRDPQAARHAASEFEIPQADSDFARAIVETDADFVDIITPPHTHIELVDTALRCGKAVICQKPLAPDFKTAVRLAELVRTAGLPFMVHENFRFQPWHREIKRLIESGAIGTNLHGLTFRTRMGDGWGADAYLGRQPYFREMPRLLIHETGVHFIDTFRYLAGEIDEVYAILRRLNPVIRGEDAGLVSFRFAAGMVGVWDANRYNESTAENPRHTFGEFLVEGNAGSIRLYPNGRLTVTPLGRAEQDHAYRQDASRFGGDAVYATQRHFVDRLHTGDPFETNINDYLKTLVVQEAVYRSAAENRPVRTAEVESGFADRPIARTAGSQKPAKRIIDLSLPVKDGLPGVSIRPAKAIAEDGWNAVTLSLYSHSGTHMDAPRHFLPDGATLDRQDLAACCGDAWVIDLTPVTPRELIGPERLAAWADRIRPGDRLLLRTDWHHRFGTPAWRDELPRLSLELAHWLVDRGVALVGVEPPSVADVNNLEELTAVHQKLFRGGVVIVEGLAHLDQVRAERVEFAALPLKVIDGDGCPVRAIAIEPQTF